MNYAITVFILEDGCVDEVVGPIASLEQAKAMVDGKIASLQSQYAGYIREDDPDGLLVLVTDQNSPEDYPGGYVFQIHDMTPAPEVVSITEVVNVG